ncbi:MAG TPA: hypothetical protein VFO77_12390, partial [Actinoplanes sp.]|nr:hypothetical protein [Actinoplanes sp.]
LSAAVENALSSVDPADDSATTRVLQEAGTLFMESLTADETWYLLNAEFRAQALRQPELRASTAAAEQVFHDALATLLQDMLDRLGLRLTVDPHAAVITIITLYETMLQRALLNESPSAADNSFLTEVLPRVLAALVTQKTGETS